MNFEPVLINEQRELAINFLIDVCCFERDEAEKHQHNVILDNVWNANSDHVGYYEISEDICVTNADTFFNRNEL